MKEYGPAFDEIKKKQGAYLPHWTADRGIYHIVFRLADSLPYSVVEEFKAERDSLLQRTNISIEDRDRLQYLLSERIDSYLDAGDGECLMKHPEAAAIVANAAEFFNRKRYQLYAWCVMPNHVHLILEPTAGEALPKILHSLKSYTSKNINSALDRRGTVWQPEYFDHLIRSEVSLARTVAYVLNNPAKANLSDWKWLGATS